MAITLILIHILSRKKFVSLLKLQINSHFIFYVTWFISKFYENWFWQGCKQHSTLNWSLNNAFNQSTFFWHCLTLFCLMSYSWSVGFKRASIISHTTIFFIVMQSHDRFQKSVNHKQTALHKSLNIPCLLLNQIVFSIGNFLPQSFVRLKVSQTSGHILKTFSHELWYMLS